MAVPSRIVVSGGIARGTGAGADLLRSAASVWADDATSATSEPHQASRSPLLIFLLVVAPGGVLALRRIGIATCKPPGRGGRHRPQPVPACWSRHRSGEEDAERAQEPVDC
jgi:hypothetical protein